MSVRTCATIEARMTSSRLPGKVLKPVLGKPTLELMIERVKRAPSLDDIVLATTTNADDDPLAELADDLGINCFRGSEDDVLDRVLKAAQANDIDVIAELTGDCPLLDPAIIERAIEEYRTSGADYVSNSLTPSYPIGMGVQVFARSVLEDVASRTDDPEDHEHVTLFIYRAGRNLYTQHNFSAPESLTDPYLRLTLDTEEDLTVIERVFEELYPTDPAFTLNDTLAFLKANPAVREINNHVAQRWV